MGLSASQARLLSITKRLSNNELQSEIIANDKMRLSTKQTTAMDKYIAALDSTKLDYNSYDETGIQQAVALTFNSMTQYTPLKNQYNLYNTEGQIIVSATDARNFEESSDLLHFLDKYGLVEWASDSEEIKNWERGKAGESGACPAWDKYRADYEEYERIKASLELYHDDGRTCKAYLQDVLDWREGKKIEREYSLGNIDIDEAINRWNEYYGSRAAEADVNVNVPPMSFEDITNKKTYSGDAWQAYFQGVKAGTVDATDTPELPEVNYGDNPSTSADESKYQYNTEKWSNYAQKIYDFYKNQDDHNEDIEEFYENYNEEYKKWRVQKETYEFQKPRWDYMKSHGLDTELGTTFKNLMDDPSSIYTVDYCYKVALGGTTGCYEHFLNALLNGATENYKRDSSGNFVLDSEGNKIVYNFETRSSHNTTIGTTITTTTGYGGMGADYSGYEYWKNASGTDHKVQWYYFYKIAMSLNDTYSDGSLIRFCDGVDKWDKTKTLAEQEQSNCLCGVKFSHNPVTDYASLTNSEKALLLKSDWHIKSDAQVVEEGGKYIIKGLDDFELKTIKQKAIDLYQLINGYSGFVNVEETLRNFTEGDMMVREPQDPGPWTPAEPIKFEEDRLLDWPDYETAVEPVPPEEPIVNDKINDKAKGQWYVNLWYAMDGSNVSDIVKTVYNEESNFDYWTVQNQEKTTKQEQKVYVVMDDKLAGDASWIQFALTNAIVTMKQAALRTTDNITWEGIEFLSTSDIKEVDDSKKIAKAEAEYKKTLAQIQAEDKQFDIQLKKLDTEHSALKAEVDSIKNVMSKNIEKSFTAFS